MRGKCLYMLSVYMQGGIPSGTIPPTGDYMSVTVVVVCPLSRM